MSSNLDFLIQCCERFLNTFAKYNQYLPLVKSLDVVKKLKDGNSTEMFNQIMELNKNDQGLVLCALEYADSNLFKSHINNESQLKQIQNHLSVFKSVVWQLDIQSNIDRLDYICIHCQDLCGRFLRPHRWGDCTIVQCDSCRQKQTNCFDCGKDLDQVWDSTRCDECNHKICRVCSEMSACGCGPFCKKRGCIRYHFCTGC